MDVYVKLLYVYQNSISIRNLKNDNTSLYNLSEIHAADVKGHAFW